MSVNATIYSIILFPFRLSLTAVYFCALIIGAVFRLILFAAVFPLSLSLLLIYRLIEGLEALGPELFQCAPVSGHGRYFWISNVVGRFNPFECACLMMRILNTPAEQDRLPILRIGDSKGLIQLVLELFVGFALLELFAGYALGYLAYRSTGVTQCHMASGMSHSHIETNVKPG